MIKSIKMRFILRAVIIAAGLLFMCIGIWQGELTAIMRKAVVICMECIGIG